MVLKLLLKPYNKTILRERKCVNYVTFFNNYVTINGVYRLNFVQ